MNMSTPATLVIIEGSPTSTRHTYCEECFKKDVTDTPLMDDERVLSAQAGEQCEICEL